MVAVTVRVTDRRRPKRGDMSARGVGGERRMRRRRGRRSRRRTRRRRRKKRRGGAIGALASLLPASQQPATSIWVQ